jgi:hypothetical protein
MEAREGVSFSFGRGILSVSAIALFVGCFLSPLPDVRTAADRARQIEPKCRSLSNEDTAQVVSPDVIDSVEPSYAFVLGGPNGREARFRGARIHVRPIAGASRESIARTVECHQAETLLGRGDAAAFDPYVLPDRWLSTDVESERDGFVVNVQTDDIEDAKRVLDRARSFARARSTP